jgi:hypothetical protein
MNGHPAGLAYVRFGDGPFVPVCMTVIALAADGRISGMDTFVLPEQFKAWGFPAELEPATAPQLDGAAVGVVRRHTALPLQDPSLDR